MTDQRNPIEAVKYGCLSIPGEFIGELDVGKSVAFNVTEDGKQRVVARQTNGVWRIEADGVNVIDCGAIDVDPTSDYFKLVNATGGYGFDLRKLDSPARYRVLLERIE
jgi:hypothetical protein